MKRINLIKMLFPSIHPPYISWFYLNQCFLEIIFSIKRFLKKKKKGQNQDASYGPYCLKFCFQNCLLKFCRYSLRRRPLREINFEEKEFSLTLFFKLVTKESLKQISSPSVKFSYPVNLFKKTHA